MLKSVKSATGVRAPVHRSFEWEMAQLEALSGRVPNEDGIARVRRALGNENNYLVAKAARLAADHSLSQLIPELLAAYDRFFTDPVTRDPQCWAKVALAKALAQLRCRDSAVYLRGLRHVQEEPSWGGQSDTAAPLRAACTHGLAASEGFTEAGLLNLLLEPLVDRDKTVRIEAVRAIGNIGGITAGLLLKLRVLVRQEDPEVLGACFSTLIEMDHGGGAGAISLVAEFLAEGEEAAAEAAFALAETRHPVALAALIARRRKGADVQFASVLDQAIASTRTRDGLDFLLAMVEKDPRQAASALEAISRVYDSPEMRERVAASIKIAGHERAEAAFLQFFPPIPS